MRPAVRNNIVVPRPTDRSFYGHGIPGVDLAQLAGKLIVVEGADGSSKTRSSGGAVSPASQRPSTSDAPLPTASLTTPVVTRPFSVNWRR